MTLRAGKLIPPIDSRYLPALASAVVLGLLYLGGCVMFGHKGFTNLGVITNLFRDENAILGITAVGVTFVILSGGIDLSAGGMVAFTSMLVATLVYDPAHNPDVVGEINQTLPHALNPLLAIGIALAAGALIGAAMGCLIHFFKLPAFLVTLGGMFFTRGMAFMIRGESLSIRHPFYLVTIQRSLTARLAADVVLPFTVFCFITLFAAGLFIAHITRFGRRVYAVGGDENSAVLMGLPVGRTKVLVYTLSGFCSAAAGVVYTFSLGKGDPLNAGVSLELDAIAAAVIGGTLLSGGVGFLAGTLMGVLTYGLIQTLINNANLDASWTRIAIGVLVLVFILLQNIVSRTSARRSEW